MRQSIILEMERMRFPIYRGVAAHTVFCTRKIDDKMISMLIGDKMINMLILSGVVRNKNKTLTHCFWYF